MRGVLDALEMLEALHDAGVRRHSTGSRRIVVFVVNSLSSPPTHWDKSESPPGTVDILLKAAGMPIDHYSFEAVELLKDTAARWQTLRASCATRPGCRPTRTRRICDAMRVPNAEIYAIDVSFAALKDKAERDYLNDSRRRSCCRRRPSIGCGRRGHDHHGFARVSSGAEGCWRDDRARSPLP